MSVCGRGVKWFVPVFVAVIFVMAFFPLYDTLAVSPPVVPEASVVPLPYANLEMGTAETPEQVSASIMLLFYLTIIAIAPTFLLMMTCLPRILVVLHFLRAALGTQSTPPNQVLMGLALFLTLFLMGPTFTRINDEALKPFSAGVITQEVAIERGLYPLREFMLSQVETHDMALFMDLSGETYESSEDVPIRVIIPAFVIGELKKGFMIGFILYIPFIVIDMVVASVLMSMGMMMLPPAMISLPFKLLVFVLVDGWNLVIGQLMHTFSGG